MEVFLVEAQKRKMSEMALTAFRKRLSPQTGWIHLFIENALDARQDSIPLVENFLYVHALFRSKIAVNIQEGKALLERILAFEVSGNFPLYLHDYPSCHDPKLSSYFLFGQLFPPSAPAFFIFLQKIKKSSAQVGLQKLRKHNYAKQKIVTLYFSGFRSRIIIDVFFQ